MNAIDICMPLTKKWEGYAKRLANDWVVAYQDITGVWTIGYGATGAAIGEGSYWTRSQADMDLDRRLQTIQTAVVLASPILASHLNALAAVIDFAYNLGVGAYRASTLKRRIDAQLWEAAAKEFSRWVIAGGKSVAGLVARRADETTLFLTPDDRAPTDTVQPATDPATVSAPDTEPQRDLSVYSWGQLRVAVSALLSWLADRIKP